MGSDRPHVFHGAAIGMAVTGIAMAGWPCRGDGNGWRMGRLALSYTTFSKSLALNPYLGKGTASTLKNRKQHVVFQMDMVHQVVHEALCSHE